MLSMKVRAAHLQDVDSISPGGNTSHPLHNPVYSFHCQETARLQTRLVAKEVYTTPVPV